MTSANSANYIGEWAQMYREAASRGSRDALFHLGYMFWHGLGTTRNRKQVTPGRVDPATWHRNGA